jgi:hypothetical protein
MNINFKTALLALSISITPLSTIAGDILNMDTNPEISQYSERPYVVKKGDTLWDISKHFLGNAYFWPEIWYINSQIKNPHLIYPGDKLTLYYDSKNNKYILNVVRLKEEKWNPEGKTTEANNYIPAIDLNKIRQEIGELKIFDSFKEYENTKKSKILSERNNQILIGSGDIIHISKHADLKKGDIVYIYSKPLEIKHNNKTIYESEKVGKALVTKELNNSMEALVQYSRKEIKEDDWISDKNIKLSDQFIPLKNTVGKTDIIKIYENRHYTGKYQHILIDKGYAQGIKEGDVFEIIERARNEDHEDFSKGRVMVYKNYENTSYGLIYKSDIEIHKDDYLK